MSGKKRPVIEQTKNGQRINDKPTRTVTTHDLKNPKKRDKEENKPGNKEGVK